MFFAMAFFRHMPKILKVTHSFLKISYITNNPIPLKFTEIDEYVSTVLQKIECIRSVVLVNKSVKLERKCVKLSVSKGHFRGFFPKKIFPENCVIFFQKFSSILFNTSLPIQYKNLKEFEILNLATIFKTCLVFSDIDS